MRAEDRSSRRHHSTILEARSSNEIKRIESWSPALQKYRAYERILLDIILGALPPSTRLDEDGLAERYGVGLAGVRDALGRLSLEGLVERRARSGTTVTPLSIEDVEQAFEIRGLIEPHAAALAAARATPTEVAAIRTALEGAKEAAGSGDYRALIAKDLAFHRAVAVGSHNVTLVRMVAPLNNKAARFWRHFMNASPEHDHVEDVSRHLAVVSAIAEHDPEAARQAMRDVLGVFPRVVTEKTQKRGAAHSLKQR
jgi:DNA-binding GntR family transcriptional regulator